MLSMLPNVPQSFVTERLFIRLPMPGDGKAVFEAQQASLKEMLPWIHWAHYQTTLEQTENGVRYAHEQYMRKKDLRLHLFDKQTGVFVGSSGLHNINWSVPRMEIGYWMDTRHSGKGYMTEAVAGITGFAFQELGVHRLEIHCDPDNKQSRAIPEKLGYELEAVLKQNSISTDGRSYRDTCLYVKLNQDRYSNK
ncbi:GNAT family N-acetyltransferase [Alkalicoccobacillus plakortidis]|uniref:GNAT family N-acetyltransferase n=1 Tax=Alkalicoccobacillus plakortidis TaxID=444060 RepID=A0ABT0XN41_9BACI|nr:GNAT family N-acetyltransferase [Alkalicoccobacillus plakortidis]MCM2677242.1 GNAT family N-acetyltransferase [Alkalicoccobacillus plakortidis]